MTNDPICLVGQIAVVGDGVLSDEINIIQEVLKAQNTPIQVDLYKKKSDVSVEVPTKYDTVPSICLSLCTVPVPMFYCNRFQERTKQML